MFRVLFYIYMKGVIFAAGKGTRFLPLTNTIPKALILVDEKPVIFYALDALEPFVDEFIIVVGHLSELVISSLGNTYKNKPITYVTQRDMKGTAGALWSIKDLLHGQRFIIAHCDDVIFQSDIQKMISHDYTIGIYPLHRSFTLPKTFSINHSQEGVFTGLSRPDPEDTVINTATGVYVLDDTFFQEDPIKLSNGEYGLPQTLVEFAKKNTVHTILFSQWLPVNSPEEQIRAESILKAG